MANKPPCPMCHTNTNVETRFSETLFRAICSTAKGGCGERSGLASSRVTALEPWARAARERAKLLAMIPVYGKEPDGLGNYWWQSDNEKDSPVLCIIDAFCGRLWAIRPDIEENTLVSDMGGQWAECLPPGIPKGEG